MSTIFGDFLHVLPPSQEYLILSFSPGSISLQKRWRNNCLSADFLADYLSTFFLDTDNCESELKKQIQIKSAVSYIANELLENAMKYSNKSSRLPISIQIHLNYERIIFQTTNSLEQQNLNNFQAYIKKMLDSDADELYLNVLEKNALDENNENSGLGFLTMINDYNAKLGWKFETFSQKFEEIGVTTMVQLQI